jgi:hypothetical protein
MSNPNETNPTPNPFDNLSALRLDQNFAGTVGVKKLLTSVPVRKTNKQDFVRVRRDPSYRLTPAAIIELKEDREVYLVAPRHGTAAPWRVQRGSRCNSGVTTKESPGVCKCCSTKSNAGPDRRAVHDEHPKIMLNPNRPGGQRLAAAIRATPALGTTDAITEWGIFNLSVS